MTPDKARQIIAYAVETTRPRWSEFGRSWIDIDRIFIHHGYEQGGFEVFKFLPLLEERGIYSIEALGGILENIARPQTYDRDYAGGFDSRFYRDLRNGAHGQVGVLLHECVEIFLSDKMGNPGAFFWRMIWHMLVCCSYLKKNHNSSFKEFLKCKYAEYIGEQTVTDTDLLNASAEEWSDFVSTARPWRELYGIGQNTFDFILGDIAEARFASDSFKFDKANQHFFRVTGISDIIVPFDRKNTVNFIRSLSLPYSLRQANTGIYHFCSLTEAHNFGYCRKKEKCFRCGVAQLCNQRFTEVNA
jgi:hypothetical protein